MVSGDGCAVSARIYTVQNWKCQTFTSVRVGNGTRWHIDWCWPQETPCHVEGVSGAPTQRGGGRANGPSERIMKIELPDSCNQLLRLFSFLPSVKLHLSCWEKHTDGSCFRTKCSFEYFDLTEWKYTARRSVVQWCLGKPGPGNSDSGAVQTILGKL